MTVPTESVALRELLDKSAVTEVLHTVAHAMDTRDWDLFADCYAPEAEGDYVNAKAAGREAIVAGTKAFLEPLDATQHLVGNIRVTVDGDIATTHATFVAQHVREGASDSGQYLLGGVYQDTLRRTGADWKITRRRIRGLWSNGDAAVLTIPVS
ncbi:MULTISPECIES: nuclear transport factor 2 family protein [unclassified Streptomyces]|uniref:nuclear transport factor 2 family protein n=1 Tax=unclassified Streptomyces TaxID=2593676 RepID=UPI000A697AFA|nr:MULTISPECIES: nuclear transport factor 2 family protein [unclassified Streptomyces]AZM58641.1 nuclear transport factor 2 family protein [Streptomyces sp. WAC 01438]RSM88334.1 nuclear transport factor 2 family protein [Streptomyces sp. WAC 01420]